jgi:hypothetical protein
MTLEDLLANLHELDDELTIFVAPDHPPRCSSEAIAVVEPEGGVLAVEGATGMRYLLEVNLAKDVVEVWREHGGDNSLESACRAILHYASHDAYLDPNSARLEGPGE